MDRFLKRWTLRLVVLIALVLVVPLGHASAQIAPAGISIMAQEEPEDADAGPSNEAVGPDFGMEGDAGRDRPTTEATGVDTRDENGMSVDVIETPIGGNEGP